MKTINITANDKELSVSWKHDSLFKSVISLQRSILFIKEDAHRLSFEPTSDTTNNIEKFFNNLWSKALEQKCYDGLPNNPVIVDIGSGIGIMDVLAYKYLNNTGKFYLLDKSERTYNSAHNLKFYHSTKHGFYHSDLVTADVLENSGCDVNAFVHINPTDSWPAQVDLITSWGSYCWHYPLDVYWDKVKNHLKVGGKLSLEILRTADEEQNFIKRISEEFKSSPTIQEMSDVNGPTGGYRCVWIRNE